MAKQRTHAFRVGKIEIIKSVARRPKGLFRPDKIHRDETKYRRVRAKAHLKKELKEES
jgi:hypothetical protein